MTSTSGAARDGARPAERPGTRSGPREDAIFLLTPEAYRYYLPAYMLRSLDDLETTDVAIDATLATLRGDEGFNADRLASLTFAWALDGQTS